MENKFKVSQAAESIKQYLPTVEFKFDEEQTKFFKPDREKIKKAIIIICDSWNRNEKSRNFIKHLVAAFWGITNFDKVGRFDTETLKNKMNRCAILGCFVTGIIDISEFEAKFFIDKLKIQTAQNEEERNQIIETVKKEMAKYPLVIREHRFAYCSDKTDKFLSPEAYFALTRFTEEMLMGNDREMFFTLKKFRIKEANESVSKKNQLNNKEINEVTRATTYSIKDGLSKDTLDKLAKIKKELE